MRELRGACVNQSGLSSESREVPGGERLRTRLLALI